VRGALSESERLEIYDRHREGETLAAIARDMGIGYETARKWYRIGRREGRAALVGRKRRPSRTVLFGVPESVRERMRQRLDQVRREHPNWGVPYLHAQLAEDPELTDYERAHIPSIPAIYRYLHEVEEDPFRKRHLPQHVPASAFTCEAQHAHHLWQVDLKEKCQVAGLDERITVLTGRDVYSSVTVASEVVALQRHDASLQGGTIQEICRTCFTRWGLPDRFRTDNGSCFTGTVSQTGFPSYFTLWLAGLGIVHETIPKGRPQQNGCVERYNRTYSNLVLRDGSYRSVADLQRVSDQTVAFLNGSYPSRAGSCEHRAPLEAHPEATSPQRPYDPDGEHDLFSLQRVDAELARYGWRRRADKVGKISLGRQSYCVGRENAGRLFDVTFDPKDRHYALTSPCGDVHIRLPARGLEVDDFLDIASSQRKRLYPNEKRDRL